ncbi:hypothetical protein PanWU01x14_069950 [Parasponia andersonii]|uniref:Uncharacterized protein n=1 Tax=Parasponia andersonii TaxID=3476 RepID=A0A2P5DEU4_PARAD|nr:hypothetical protein PanWU01x14_069950 [Parasponia andersonii]
MVQRYGGCSRFAYITLVSLSSASNVSRRRQARLVARQCSRLIVVSGGGEEKGSNGGDNSAEKGSKKLLPYALISSNTTKIHYDILYK